MLSHAPSLCSGLKETSTLGSPNDILDDPLLNSTPISHREARESFPSVSQGKREGASSPASQGESSRPQSPKTSAPESTTTTSPPPYSPIYPKLPNEEKPSPVGHTRSGASHLPAPSGLLPLREVAGTEGPTQAHSPFSIADLQQCEERLGNFSEDPSCSIINFVS